MAWVAEDPLQSDTAASSARKVSRRADLTRFLTGYQRPEQVTSDEL